MMKKYLLLLVLAVSVVGVRAQDLINFYGVDFSKVRVTGSDESPEKFVVAFEGINNLMISEAGKFDVAKFLVYMDSEVDVEKAIEQISKVGKVNFYGKSLKSVNSDDVKELINVYSGVKVENDSPIGLVIIADELNKIANKGTFVYVLFDRNTKEVISQKKISGKAKGFGLRNFWAGSLYESMRSWKRSGETELK